MEPLLDVTTSRISTTAAAFNYQTLVTTAMSGFPGTVSAPNALVISVTGSSPTTTVVSSPLYSPGIAAIPMPRAPVAMLNPPPRTVDCTRPLQHQDPPTVEAAAVMTDITSTSSINKVENKRTVDEKALNLKDDILLGKPESAILTREEIESVPPETDGGTKSLDSGLELALSREVDATPSDGSVRFQTNVDTKSSNSEKAANVFVNTTAGDDLKSDAERVQRESKSFNVTKVKSGDEALDKSNSTACSVINTFKQLSKDITQFLLVGSSIPTASVPADAEDNDPSCALSLLSDFPTLDIPLPPPIDISLQSSAGVQRTPIKADAVSSSNFAVKQAENSDTVIREMYLGPSVEYLVDLTANDPPSSSCNLSSIDDTSLGAEVSSPVVDASQNDDVEERKEEETDEDTDEAEAVVSQSISSWEISGEPASVKASSTAEVQIVSRKKDCVNEDDAVEPSWQLLRISKEMSREEESFVRSKSEQLKTMKQRLAEEFRLEDYVKSWESSFDVPIPPATPEKSEAVGESKKGGTDTAEKIIGGEQNLEKVSAEKLAHAGFDNVNSGTFGGPRVIKFKLNQANLDAKLTSTSIEKPSGEVDDSTTLSKGDSNSTTDIASQNSPATSSVAKESRLADVAEKSIDVSASDKKNSNDRIGDDVKVTKDSSGDVAEKLSKERNREKDGRDRNGSGDEDDLSKRLLSLSRELELMDRQRVTDKERLTSSMRSDRTKDHDESRRETRRSPRGRDIDGRDRRHESRDDSRRKRTPENNKHVRPSKAKSSHVVEDDRRGRSADVSKSRTSTTGEDSDRRQRQKRHRSRSESHHAEDRGSRLEQVHSKESKHKRTAYNNDRSDVNEPRSGVSESMDYRQTSDVTNKRSSRGGEINTRKEYRDNLSSSKRVSHNLKDTEKSRELRNDRPSGLEEDNMRNNRKKDALRDLVPTEDYHRPRDDFREDYIRREGDYHSRRDDRSRHDDSLAADSIQHGRKKIELPVPDRREGAYDLRHELEKHRRIRNDTPLDLNQNQHSRARCDSEAEVVQHARDKHDSELTEHRRVRLDSASQLAEHHHSRHELVSVSDTSLHRRARHDSESEVTESRRVRYDVGLDTSRQRRKGYDDSELEVVQDRHAEGRDLTEDVTQHRRTRHELPDVRVVHQRSRAHDSDVIESNVTESRNTRHGSYSESTEQRRVISNTASHRRNKDAEEYVSGDVDVRRSKRTLSGSDARDVLNAREKRKRRRSKSGTPVVSSRIRPSEMPLRHSAIPSAVVATNSSTSKKSTSKKSRTKPPPPVSKPSRRSKKQRAPAVAEFFGQLSSVKKPSRKGRDATAGAVSGGVSVSTGKDQSPEDVVWIDDAWDCQHQSLIEWQEKTSTLLGACLNTRKELENEYERRHASKRKQRRDEKRKERRKARRGEIAALNANGVVCDLVSDSDNEVVAWEEFDATQDVIFTSTSPAAAAGSKTVDGGRHRKSRRDRTKKKGRSVKLNSDAGPREENQNVGPQLDPQPTDLVPSSSEIILAQQAQPNVVMPKKKRRKKSDDIVSTAEGRTSSTKKKGKLPVVPPGQRANINLEIIRITTQFDDAEENLVEINNSLNASKELETILRVGGSPGAERRVNVSNFAESTPAAATKRNRGSLDRLEISVANTGKPDHPRVVSAVTTANVTRTPSIGDGTASVSLPTPEGLTESGRSGRHHAIEQLSPIERRVPIVEGRNFKNTPRDVASESCNSTEPETEGQFQVNKYKRASTARLAESVEKPTEENQRGGTNEEQARGRSADSGRSRPTLTGNELVHLVDIGSSPTPNVSTDLRQCSFTNHPISSEKNRQKSERRSDDVYHHDDVDSRRTDRTRTLSPRERQSQAYDPLAPSSNDDVTVDSRRSDGTRKLVSSINDRHNDDVRHTYDARKTSTVESRREDIRLDDDRENRQRRSSYDNRRTLNVDNRSADDSRRPYSGHQRVTDGRDDNTRHSLDAHRTSFTSDRRNDAHSSYDTRGENDDTVPSFDAFDDVMNESVDDARRSFNARDTDVSRNNSEIRSTGARNPAHDTLDEDTRALDMDMSPVDDVADDEEQPIFNSTRVDTTQIKSDASERLERRSEPSRAADTGPQVRVAEKGDTRSESMKSWEKQKLLDEKLELERSQFDDVDNRIVGTAAEDSRRKSSAQRVTANLSNESLVEEVWNVTNNDHLAAVAAFEQNWYKQSIPTDIDVTAAVVSTQVVAHAAAAAYATESLAEYPDDCYMSPSGVDFNESVTEYAANNVIQSANSTSSVTQSSSLLDIADGLVSTTMSCSVGSDLNALTSSIAANLLSSSLGMSLYANPSSHASLGNGKLLSSSSQAGTSGLLASSLGNVNLLANALSEPNFLSDPTLANMLSGPLATGLLSSGALVQNQPMSFEVAQKLAEELMKLIPTQKQQTEAASSAGHAKAVNKPIKSRSSQEHKSKIDKHAKSKEAQRAARRSKSASVRAPSKTPVPPKKKNESTKVVDSTADENTVYDPEDPRSFNFDDLDTFSPPSPSYVHDDKTKQDKSTKKTQSKVESKLAANQSCAEVKVRKVYQASCFCCRQSSKIVFPVLIILLKYIMLLIYYY